ERQDAKSAKARRAFAILGALALFASWRFEVGISARRFRRTIPFVKHDWLLAIETSSRDPTVALARDGQVLSRAWLEPPTRGGRPAEANRTTTSLSVWILPTIESTLAWAGLRMQDLAVLAFSQGPGSFTGLRVAATIARMAQAVAGCRVVAVPTLE